MVPGLRCPPRRGPGPAGRRGLSRPRRPDPAADRRRTHHRRVPPPERTRARRRHRPQPHHHGPRLRRAARRRAAALTSRIGQRRVRAVRRVERQQPDRDARGRRRGRHDLRGTRGPGRPRPRLRGRHHPSARPAVDDRIPPGRSAGAARAPGRAVRGAGHSHVARPDRRDERRHGRDLPDRAGVRRSGRPRAGRDRELPVRPRGDELLRWPAHADSGAGRQSMGRRNGRRSCSRPAAIAPPTWSRTSTTPPAP